jgi:succinate dehydrogenase / fumarate reductase cytochrome b subunit
MGVFVVTALLFILSLVAFRGDEFQEAASAAQAITNLV